MKNNALSVPVLARFNTPYGTQISSKSRFRTHSANMKTNKRKCNFTSILATLGVIFCPFRTLDFIEKTRENRPRRAILTRKIQCFHEMRVKNAFLSDTVCKRDLAKTVVK